MKFEQAFYTRVDLKGLGVVAASNIDRTFIDKCIRVGSNFEIEPSDDTAEFVFYSKDFGKYVGVGVSPSSYETHSGINKLVHIFVPEVDSANPEDYYLPYVFDRTVDCDKHYESKIFSPVLCEGDFERIISDYAINQKQLAMLIYKSAQVALKINNFLAIVIPDNLYTSEELRVLAREITWLIYKLIPLPDSEKENYRKNLSYSVLSQSNISRVNIAFVSKDIIQNNSYFFGEEVLEEVPDLYMELAKRALSSKKEYDDFVKTIFNLRIEKRVSLVGIEVAFLSWKLQTENLILKTEELPISFNSLLYKSQKEDSYRFFLYHVVPALTNLSDKELENLAINIFWPVIKQMPIESTGEDFYIAYENAISDAYLVNYKTYKVYIEYITGELKNTVLNDLWNNDIETSCIFQDLAAIATAKEGIDKLNLYKTLQTNREFIIHARNKILNYYFDMEINDREYVSDILRTIPNEEESGWDISIRDKIADYFCMDSFADFMEKEIKKIEPVYACEYFTHYLQKCQECSIETEQKKLQKLGRKFLRCYKKNIPNKDYESFGNLDKSWTLNRVRDKIAALQTLDEVAVFADFGDFFDDYKVELIKIWYDEILSRLNADALTDTIVVVNLLKREDDIRVLGSDVATAFEEKLWETYRSKLLCDWSQMDIEALANVILNNEGLNKFEDRIKTEWCKVVIDKLPIETITENVIDPLVRKVCEIQSLDIETEYKDAVWEACGSNLNMLFFCSYYFDITKYSVWSKIDFADITSYEYIQKAAEHQGAYQKIENTNINNIREDAEINRICYCLWKQNKQDKLLNLNLLERFPLERYRKQLVAYFKDILQSDLLSNTDSQSCIRYLQIEVFMDDPWAKSQVSTADERCEEYEKIRTNNTTFYNALRSCSTYGISKSISQRLTEIRIFEKLFSRPEVSEENVESSYALLQEAKGCFGDDVVLVTKLQGEWENLMDKLKEEQEDLQRKIDAETQEINQIEDEIRKLEEKKKGLIVKRDNNTRRRDKIKQKRDIRKNKKNSGIEQLDTSKKRGSGWDQRTNPSETVIYNKPNNNQANGSASNKASFSNSIGLTSEESKAQTNEEVQNTSYTSGRNLRRKGNADNY